MTDYIVVERSLPITASPEELSQHIVDFHKWLDWSPWEGLDPNLSRTYSGSGSGVGAKYEWAGNKKAGAGNMLITSVEPAAIKLDLNFTKPFKSETKTTFDFAQDGDVTTVVWKVLTPKSFMLRVAGIFMNLDKQVGPDLEKGLAALKAIVEE